MKRSEEKRIKKANKAARKAIARRIKKAEKRFWKKLDKGHEPEDLAGGW